MDKVLIALDYDVSAPKVAKKGFSMAKAMDTKIVLLHVISEISHYSTPGYSPILGFTGFVDMGPMKLESADALKDASMQFLDNIKQQLGEETIQTLVLEGDVAESILLAAKEVKADIIVMGSHSKKWLENIVMGSVTETVLNNTSIPLFIIPVKEKKGKS